jgi:hypothetical protein
MTPWSHDRAGVEVFGLNNRSRKKLGGESGHGYPLEELIQIIERFVERT